MPGYDSSHLALARKLLRICRHELAEGTVHPVFSFEGFDYVDTNEIADRYGIAHFNRDSIMEHLLRNPRFKVMLNNDNTIHDDGRRTPSIIVAVAAVRGGETNRQASNALYSELDISHPLM